MQKLQIIIKKFLEERGWNTLRPSDVAKSIIIESAELLELFQWENLELEEIKKDHKKIKKIENELADVFLYALQMSVLLDLDSKKIITNKLELVKQKYPADLMKKRANKELGEKVYWNIKMKHRKKTK